MKNITLNRGTFGLQEDSIHVLSIEASTLGLPPGSVPPNAIDTDLGNGRRFLYTGMDAHGTMNYAQELGCIVLRIFND